MYVSILIYVTSRHSSVPLNTTARLIDSCSVNGRVRFLISLWSAVSLDSGICIWCVLLPTTSRIQIDKRREIINGTAYILWKPSMVSSFFFYVIYNIYRIYIIYTPVNVHNSRRESVRVLGSSENKLNACIYYTVRAQLTCTSTKQY